MRNALFFGAAIGLMMLPMTATAQMGGEHPMPMPSMPPMNMPMPPMPPMGMPKPPMMQPPMGQPPMMKPPMMRPPMGQPPVIINRPGFGGGGFGYGFQLPTYWMAPTYTITNYRNYGLNKPRNGYRWSRYYDGAVLADRYGRVSDWREDMNWGDDDRGYRGDAGRGYRDSADRPLDYGSQYPGDDRVYTGYDDRQPVEGDYRDGGRYEDRGYEGNETRGYDDRDYDDRDAGRRDTRRSRSYSDRDLARLCRRDNGVGGAVIGGVLGGVAGNRIAGRGDRRAGSLIGAGIGAVAGAAIDQNEDKRQCANYYRRMEASRRAPAPNYGGGGYQGGGYGYPTAPRPPVYSQPYPPQGGYYYPQPAAAPQITVINIPGNGGGSSTSSTTTTTTYYETVSVRRPVVRKRVHKIRPRCGCR